MITSPRLLLRTLAAGDAERALAGTDPGRPVYTDGYPSAFATEVLRLVTLYPAIGHEDGADVPDLGPWLVMRRSDEVVIGTLSCARAASPAEVTVGYDIASSCRGEGYATEALGALVEHLLTLPDISRVCAETLTAHAASRRVMEKAGLRWRHDEVAEQDGREVTLAHYAVEGPTGRSGFEVRGRSEYR